MNHAELRAYCLARPGAEETTPFGPDPLVFKVMGKMFAMLPAAPPAQEEELNVVVKCAPLRGELLRETYPAVTGAYHMNKRHWISIVQDGSVPDDEVQELIDHSYRLVVQGLTRAQRAALAELGFDA